MALAYNHEGEEDEGGGAAGLEGENEQLQPLLQNNDDDGSGGQVELRSLLGATDHLYSDDVSSSGDGGDIRRQDNGISTAEKRLRSKRKRFINQSKKVLYLGTKADEDEDGIRSLIKLLYGAVPEAELGRMAWLSLTLFVIIGGFWLLDSLKDTVFERTVGLEYQPRAKLLSVAVTFLLVLEYNRLIDTTRKPVLFYLLGAFYTVMFMIIGTVLGTALGMATQRDAGPSHWIGWLSYVAIESYGSLAVALFWAFCNASVDLNQAKSAYGLIIAGAQVGAILGSTGATLTQTRQVSVYKLYIAASLSPALMAMLVWGYVYLFGEYQPRGHGQYQTVTTDDDVSSMTHYDEFSLVEKSGTTAATTTSSSSTGKPGGHYEWRERRSYSDSLEQKGAWGRAMDGLYLIREHHYLTLLFGISCLYEVVLTVLDFEMKYLGVMRYRSSGLSKEDADGSFATLMGHFGQVTNSMSLMLSLLGTSYIVRTVGVNVSLRIFPTVLLVCVTLSYLVPKLWMLFISVATLKALAYSLNEPCKEMLYLPTTDEIKFKAKGWIDVFGARCAKGIGSFVTESFRARPEALLTYGSLASLIIASGLLLISIDIGVRFNKLVQSGTIVGEAVEGGGEGGVAHVDGEEWSESDGDEYGSRNSGDQLTRHLSGESNSRGGGGGVVNDGDCGIKSGDTNNWVGDL